MKTLKAEPLDKLVKIQMYDKKFKVVPAHLLIIIRYPSLRLSGVPDSIDPEGGHAEWCSEHPARCYFERNPHPKGEYDKQRIFRPQSQICCFAPKCTECDPSTHFRMEENCIACPKCWWCIPVIIVCAIIVASVGYYVFVVRMRVNYVIFSLALDHTQILGLLAACKIQWPWQIQIILKWFVFFQMDIDVAGPECLARGLVTFENKWWFKVLMPISIMTLALLFTIFKLIFDFMCRMHKKVKKKKKTIVVKKKKKSGLQKDLAANDETTKVITFMIKAFITTVACVCK